MDVNVRIVCMSKIHVNCTLENFTAFDTNQVTSHLRQYYSL